MRIKKSLRIICFISTTVALGSITTNAHAQNINTFAGSNHPGFSGDGGQATAAELNQPWGVAADGSGNIYIVDYYNMRIRKINASGVITIAGNGSGGFSGDGGQATAAELYFPTGVAVDPTGNVYIADLQNNRIRKVNTSGIISTFAGNGTPNYSGDGGQATAAEINAPTRVTLDASGNVYIADFVNSCIRKVNASGIITTFAGNGTQGYSGDGGQATAAELYNAYDLTIDASGNAYIADTYNNVIRKVNTAGIITSIAGNGYGAPLSGGYSGDGGQATNAELYFPSGMAIDGTGNIYIGDNFNERVRIVNPSGIINTYAGNGIQGFSGDGGPAIAAEINFYGEGAGITLDASDNLYLTDSYNNRIRIVSGLILATDEITNGNSAVVYPNPSNGKFTLEVNSEKCKVNSVVEIYNLLGEKIYSSSFTIYHSPFTIDISGQPAGIYLYRIVNETGTLVSEGKFIIN